MQAKSATRALMVLSEEPLKR